MNEKGRQTKLLAAIAVLAMVVCVFAVVLPSENVDAETMSTSSIEVPEEGSGVQYVSDADGFTAALEKEGTTAIVIDVTVTNTGDDTSETKGTPTIIDLTSVSSIPSGITVYIGTEPEKNGYYDGKTNLADGSTVQVKFGTLDVAGTIYNILGQNKATSALWVDNLTLSGNGVIYSSSALNGDLSTRNGFFTSSAASKTNTPDYITHIYAAQIGTISKYVNDMTYPGLDIDEASKVIVSYGNTSVTGTVTVSDIMIYVNTGSTMNVESGASLTASSMTVATGGTVNNSGTITGTVTNNGSYNYIPKDVTQDVTSAINSQLESTTSLTVTAGTINSTVTVPEGKTVIITDDVDVGENALFNISGTTNGGAITFSNVSSGEYKVQVTSEGSATPIVLSGISGTVTISVGSIVIDVQGSGTVEVPTIPGDDSTIELKGTVDGDFTVDVKVANAKFTVPAGATFTVPEGSTFNIVTSESGSIAAESPFVVEGTLNLHGTITYNGETPLSVTKGASGEINVYGTSAVDNVTLTDATYQSDDDQFMYRGKLDQDLVVRTEQSLTGDLYIPEGFMLTVAPGGILNLNGYGIYVEGTLQVDANGSIKDIGTQSDAKYTTTDGNNAIILYRNGTIVNNGVIGSGSPVTVTASVPIQADWGVSPAIPSVPYTGNGTVVLQDVAGVSFNVTRTAAAVDSTPAQYTLGISGNVSIYGMTPVHSIDAIGVLVSGDLYIGNDVEFNANGVSVQDVDVTFYGDMNVTGNGFTMTNGSTVYVYGQVTGLITAETGKYVAPATSASGETTVSLQNTVEGRNVFVTNIVLTVERYSYTVKDIYTTEQRLIISGTVGYVGDDETGGMITVNNGVVAGTTGLSYIPDDAVLSLGNIKFEGSGTTVLGQIQYTGNVNNVTNVYGTAYTVNDDQNRSTFYVTTFEDAYAVIDTALNKQLTVYGDLTIDYDLDLTSGQRITFNGGAITIAENGTVDVQSGAIVSKQNRATIDVDGVYTIYTGGVSPVPDTYDVRKNGTDYTQYSGIVPAINNAQPGDVIEVVKNADVSNDLTVPEDVTVNIAQDVTMRFEDDLVVDGTLNNAGVISMVGDRSTITVNGTLDSSEGTIQFMDVDQNGTETVDNDNTGDDRAINSTGSTILSGANIAQTPASGAASVYNFMNGAVYVDDEDNSILTSMASANTAVSAQDGNKTITLYGTFTERNDITLGAGVNVTVAADANVTLGTITMPEATSSDSQRIDVNGTLTATINGTSGVSGSGTAASVEYSRASGVDVFTGVNTTSDGTTTAYVYLEGTVTGAVTVSAGTVNVATGNTGVTVNGTTDNPDTLTVANGAVLAVQKIGSNTATLFAGSNGTDASVTVEGTILFDGGELDVPSSATQIVDVPGTMTLADEAEVTIDGTINVTGTLSISTTADKEAVLYVSGILVVGEKPTTVGSAGTGAVTGSVEPTNSVAKGYIKAYAGADLSGALIDMDAGETQAKSTAFIVNGWTYMTVYALSGSTVDYNSILGTDHYNATEVFSLTGYVTYAAPTYQDTEGIDINRIGDWYTDAELSASASNKTIGSESALYFKANSAMVPVTISVGEGISLYIDGIRYTSATNLAVGTHTVEAVVNPGFTGDVTIYFNGQAVTNGQFTITPEMASNAYEGTVSVSATGNISQDSTVVVNGGSSDDGIGLTDILLIILVILIVVMAIIVALRLMRS